MKLFISSSLFFLVTSFFLASCSNEHRDMDVYLFRHAEKKISDTTDNPDLTKEGRRQAVEIANLLKNQNVTAIYTTQYKRNLATIKPLVDSVHPKVYYYDWSNWKEVLDSIDQRQDRCVAICGHGDILLPMIEKFGAKSPQKSIGKNEYKKVYKLSINSSQSVVKISKFK